jgi:phosphatidylglycerophosphate synthase
MAFESAAGRGAAPAPPESKRIIRTLTAPLEQRWLPVLARQLPDWVTPDMLTVSGVLTSILIGALYGYSGKLPALLWVINALLIVHWYADSLDGTLARVRHIERPRYGFFLDHAADAITTLCVCLGLGLSPLMDLRIAVGLVIVYYLMMIQVLLRAYTLREFKISYGRFGPTELRLILILANIIVWTQLTWFTNARLTTVLKIPIHLMDVLAIAAGLAMLFTFIGTFTRTLRRLAVLEPPGRHHSDSA